MYMFSCAAPTGGIVGGGAPVIDCAPDDGGKGAGCAAEEEGDVVLLLFGSSYKSVCSVLVLTLQCMFWILCGLFAQLYRRMSACGVMRIFTPSRAH